MDKRTLTAVVLSLVVLIAWSIFFKPEPVPQKPPAEEKALPPVPEMTEEQKQAEPSPALPEESPATPVSLESDVVVETDLFRAVFSTKGAIIKFWELKKFSDNFGKPVILLREPGPIPPLSIILEGENRTLPQQVVYAASTRKLVLSEKGPPRGEVIFTYSGQGVLIRKKFLFSSDSYKADVAIETENLPPSFLAVGTDFGVFDREQREHKGPVMLTGSGREEFDSNLKEPQYLTGITKWIAQEDKYFTAALIPVTPTEEVRVWKERDAAEIALKLVPQKHDLLFYAGPKEYDRLKALNVGLEHIVDFGWFAFIAMPLFWVLKFLYRFFGNYGWAIIALTIAVRVPFIPILHKSQKSMKKMQKIQPLMAEIKEKYKKDSAKMQKEMMAIYKKHKVNPVGGCLPMLLQIPVFIALYNVLLKAIELRGAPFVLWITDLAAKDPYYVMPIVMGLTMVIQQKMTPSAMDPKQAKMMMLMPIVFTFMFLTFPSGLVLYWLVNNVLGIGQQYFANKQVS
ncbi:MAG: membrane protein insertase YidC [Nitrospiraceae bacterium]|nr:MAG: membrane protein insertase YidC [Nitrospiraceae bacterium]